MNHWLRDWNNWNYWTYWRSEKHPWLTHSLTYNFKSRDASASKKENKKNNHMKSLPTSGARLLPKPSRGQPMYNFQPFIFWFFQNPINVNCLTWRKNFKDQPRGRQERRPRWPRSEDKKKFYLAECKQEVHSSVKPRVLLPVLFLETPLKRRNDYSQDNFCELKGL